MARDIQTTVNAGLSLERSAWIAVSIAALIVSLRLFAKFRISQFRVDDLAMILAIVRIRVSDILIDLTHYRDF